MSEPGLETRSVAPHEYEAFFLEAYDLFCVVGADGYFKTINAAWTRALGWTRDELLTRPYLELVHEEDHALTLGAQVGLVEHGSVQSFENRYRRKSGGYLWLRWSAVMPGDLGLFYAVGREVNDERAEEQVSAPQNLGEHERALHELLVHQVELQKQNEELRAAQAAHEAAARRYRDLHELAPTAYVTLDPNGTIIGVNRAACALLQARRSTLLGQRLARFADPTSTPLLGRCLAAVQTSDNRQSCLLGLVVDGLAPISTRLEAVALTSGGSDRAYLCTLTDVSAERRAEQANAAKLTAEQANAAKSDFLAQMSHELRTPLSGVFSALELALMEDLPVKAARHLAIAKTATTDLLTLVGDILDFAKIEAGRVDLADELFGLPEALETCLATVREAAVGKGLSISLQLDPRTPPKARGDRRRFEQIVINLLGNAIKFTERGAITVALRPADEAASKPERVALRVEVRDTGRGFDPALAEALFEPYTQESPEQYIRHGGAGLGLAIVRQIVELMHGRIWAESQPGIGSVFRFVVELDRPRAVDDCYIDESLGTGAVVQAIRPLRILLVDDNPICQLVIAEILRHDGHDVLIAENGLVALELLPAGSFDLALVDRQMPKLDGPALTRIIRAGTLEGVPADLLIIGLSALLLRSSGDDRDVCIDAGMNAVLAKPLDREHLYRTIAEQGAPRSINTPGRRALWWALENDPDLALKVDAAVLGARDDKWRASEVKCGVIRAAISPLLGSVELVARVFAVIVAHDEY